MTPLRLKLKKISRNPKILKFSMPKKMTPKTPKNRYTRKQPTYFLMTPVRPKLKNFFSRNPKILKFSMPKKMAPKSQAKIKPFLQYPIFNYF